MKTSYNLKIIDRLRNHDIKDTQRINLSLRTLVSIISIPHTSNLK